MSQLADARHRGRTTVAAFSGCPAALMLAALLRLCMVRAVVLADHAAVRAAVRAAARPTLAAAAVAPTAAAPVQKHPRPCPRPAAAAAAVRAAVRADHAAVRADHAAVRAAVRVCHLFFCPLDRHRKLRDVHASRVRVLRSVA